MENFSDSIKYLRVGSMESTLAVRLPGFISSFRSAYPAVKLGVYSGPTDDLIEQLLSNQIDIGFIGGQFQHPNLQGRVAFSEEMVLATDKSVSELTQIGNLPIIVFKPGCSYRAFSQIWMRRSGLSPNEVIELGTLDGILGCVASGVGVTLLPRSVVESSRHSDILNMHVLSDEDRFIDTVAIYNTDVPENGAVDAFIDHVCLGRQEMHGEQLHLRQVQ